MIGAGAFGGWTALYLREMGLSVTLVDAHGPGNVRSSSAGETRQIRATYGDRELYSRWVVDAFERWKTREAEWGKKLFFQTGQITLLREWTGYLQSSKTVLDRLGVDNEVIDRAELIKRFPQFNYDGVELGFYVPSTGILKCREGCLAVAEACEKTPDEESLALLRTTCLSSPISVIMTAAELAGVIGAPRTHERLSAIMPERHGVTRHADARAFPERMAHEDTRCRCRISRNLACSWEPDRRYRCDPLAGWRGVPGGPEPGHSGVLRDLPQ